MTDNEIIKAIGYCADESKFGCPDDCPFSEECDENVFSLDKAIVDLINRQKAEIDCLRKELEKLHSHKDFLRAEIERLKEIPVSQETINRFKADVVKEFAERLKDLMYAYYECVGESAKGRPYKGDTLMDYEVVDMIEDCIDNLVKEMTE